MAESSKQPELRPYQRAAIEAILEARRAGLHRLLISLPTGAGKTVIFSHLAQMARRQVLVLAHREELLEQAYEKLVAATGGKVSVGVEQGNRHAPTDAKIVVCSIRSLHEERLGKVMQGRDIGLVIYDECHHAAADDNRRVLRQIGVFEKDWPGTLIGFTATTTRGDGKGLDGIFERIVYTRTLSEMIHDEYLVPLRGFRITTHADLSKISPSRGDYREDELEEAIDIEERNALVARSIQELARDRRTIAFCVTVRHAQNLARSLSTIGVPAAIVHGMMPSEQRTEVLRRFREGRFQVLTNVAVLTEGFDDPGVSCIAMARPTRSDGLYTQCVGRGTRLFTGKKDCLILDFVDLGTLDLCTLPSLFGCPRNLDLDGEDARNAQQFWNQIRFDFPSFELEASSLTLREIQQRAASFDPLTQKVDREIRAISRLSWFSLGRHGLALHFQRSPGTVNEALVLRRTGRGKCWEVSLDGRIRESFSTLEEAVLAVDYEVERIGRSAVQSAMEEATWRQQPPPPHLLTLLPEYRTTTISHGDALRISVLQRIRDIKYNSKNLLQL